MPPELSMSAGLAAAIRIRLPYCISQMKRSMLGVYQFNQAVGAVVLLCVAVFIGALVNALWLLAVLVRRGSYRPLPGWGVYLMQVIAASALLALFLIWGASAFDWIQLRAEKLKRIWLLALMLSSSVAIYFIALRAAGLKVRKLLRH